MTSAGDVIWRVPRPGVNEWTQFFWDAANDGRLEILRCQNCGHYVHLPRPICERCGSMDLAPEMVSGKGTIYSHTQVMQPFHPYFADKVPYVVGLVDLVEEPGLRLTTNIVDCDPETLRCGQEVEVVFRELEPDFSVPMFRPVPSSEADTRSGA